MPDKELEPILAILRQGMGLLLGHQLHRLVLFGSRARGDARPDSDIDLLVVLDGEFDYGELLRRTSHLVSDVSLRYDVVVSRTFVVRERFESTRTPFLMNVRREGVTL